MRFLAIELFAIVSEFSKTFKIKIATDVEFSRNMAFNRGPGVRQSSDHCVFISFSILYFRQNENIELNQSHRCDDDEHGVMPVDRLVATHRYRGLPILFLFFSYICVW